MAEHILVKFKFKQELTEDQLDPVKKEFEGKLKTKIKKEKNKGKRLEWIVKAKKPELVEEAAITKLFKRAQLNKLLKSLEIEQMK
tara:strand:+ start:1131 stop:1385 length:255 start_codon:yes stop_codon:yes gene_type:complete